MPSDDVVERRVKKRRLTDMFFRGSVKTPQPTFESKLTEEHMKFFKRAKERGPGSYTAEDTGAKGLARRRLEHYVRSGEKELKRRTRQQIVDRMA